MVAIDTSRSPAPHIAGRFISSLFEMANTISADYTISNNNNALSAGPITINSSISVTIPSGSTWVIA